MNCINCYQEVQEGAKFCPHCGAKQPESRNRTGEAVQPQMAGQGETVEQQGREERNKTVIQPEAANRSENVVQPEAAEQGETTMRAEAADGADTTVQPDTAQQQDRTSYQNGTAYQSNSTYQNGNGYQSSAGYQGGYQSGGRQNPVNWVPYLVLSIASTICCCNLFSVGFGVVGIVYSTKINSAVNAGDYQEAQDAAKKARIWIIVAFAVGVVANIIGVLFLSMGGWGYYYY